MDFGTLLLPVGTAVTGVVADVVPIGITVLVALAGISIALGVFRKFGVRR